MVRPPQYKNLINGEWVDSSSGKTSLNTNPADKEIIGEFPDSNAEDVAAAVAAAKNAYQSWRLVPAPKRAEILFRAGELLREQKDQLAKDMTREMGKVLKESGGDVQEAIDMTYFIAAEGRRLHGHTTPSELPDKFMMSVRIPLGVASIITPWNFPMAIPSWKIIPALVTGNTVVFKPAEDTPLSAHHFVRILKEAGVPAGVVNLVCGSGEAIGSDLVTHSDVSIISFTGSTEVGKIINQNAASTFKRVSLEMGGKNGIIVMEDADVDLAVDGAVWGGFGTTGQRCTAASRVLLHERVYDEFLEKFVSRAKSLKVGNGLNPQTEMGPSINEAQLFKVEKYVQIGKQEGARLMCGGARLEGGIYDQGFFYAPTIFAEVDPHMRIAREEIFGPVVAVLRIGSLDQALEIANDTPYGLSSAIYTGNVNHAFRAMRDLYTGITYINSSTIGAEVHLPFGGTKQTGNGHREGGPTVIDLFTEWKTIYVDFSGKLQKAQIDNN
ncbi:aldehyde dehydrogenase family protein [bacterium]|nr:aldehyde dehydrogenase family protein [bacterium]MCI0607198.1 aldehyde dehydrogenase family protein [bacterium]